MSALAAYLERLPPVDRTSGDRASRFADVSRFSQQLSRMGLPLRAATLLLVHAAQFACLLLGWWLIGVGALGGRLDPGWLAAWALTLVCTVPLQACAGWLQGIVAVGLGGLMKQHLLAGAMATNIDYIRRRGAGELMSEVLECEAIDEALAGGALSMALALLELLAIPVLLAFGAAPHWQVAVFGAWIALLAGLVARDLAVRWHWTRARIALTDKLVENMIAHRTRAAQQNSADWHQAEDSDLARYLATSRSLDLGCACIESLVPRGYLIVAFLTLLPEFLSGQPRLEALAVSFGAMLYAAAAFERICFSYSRVATAWIAWRMVRPIFKSAASMPLAGKVEAPDAGAGTLLKVSEIRYAHATGADAVLRGCNLSLSAGDRVLLEGTSGSGKSTFAAILAGLRAPDEGFVLSGGFDRFTLGDLAWRRNVALVPQYHENHIMSAPLIFNLLMSRPQPYGQKDFEEADDVCRELGLGDLLQRMPSRLYQFVGDTGWRLSQGERSRIFLARALLQKSPVLVLDEPLAALDPESLRQCLECIMRRAGALVLIAHP